MPAPQRDHEDQTVKAPVGQWVMFLGLEAGIKRVGLFTDMHRHINVVSYALDMMLTGMMADEAHVITIGDAKIAILNCDLTLVHGMSTDVESINWVDTLVLETLSSSYTDEEKESLMELIMKADEERETLGENGEEEPVMDGSMVPTMKDWRHLLEVLSQ